MKPLNSLMMIVMVMAFSGTAFADNDTYLCSIKEGKKKGQAVLKLKPVEQDPDSGMSESGKVRLGNYVVSLATGSGALEGPDGRGHFVPVVSYSISEVGSPSSLIPGLELSNSVVSNDGFSISIDEMRVACKLKQ